MVETHHAAPDSETEAILEMVEVTVAAAERPNVPWIEGINWRVRRGDYWVVGGLEETGKTELLTTAAGLQRPLHGALKIFGKDCSALSEADLLKDRLQIGLVFEAGGRLFNRLTVGENISLPLQYHNLAAPERLDHEVERILALMELSSCIDKLPGRIPRSAQQRVALARALVLKPQILLLDKPVLGLDPKETRWWLDFLQQLHLGHDYFDGRSLTLVVTTDDLRNWRQSGKHFAVIRNQRWAVIGNRADLDRSEEPLLRELLWPDFLTE